MSDFIPLSCRDTEPPFKACLCSAQYSEDTWRSLRRVGYQDIPEDEFGPAERLELRDCSECGSTLAVQVAT